MYYLQIVSTSLNIYHLYGVECSYFVNVVIYNTYFRLKMTQAQLKAFFNKSFVGSFICKRLAQLVSLPRLKTRQLFVIFASLLLDQLVGRLFYNVEILTGVRLNLFPEILISR